MRFQHRFAEHVYTCGVWSLALCVITSSGGCSSEDGTDESIAMDEGETFVVQSQVAAAFAVADTGDFLFRPTDIAMVGDSVLVVDNGQDRIVVLDSALQVVLSVGTTGEGPGEFRAPVHARVTESEIWISEISNGRFSVFDRSGQFRRTVSRTAPLYSFAVSSEGELIVPARSPTHHLWRIEANQEIPIAPRPNPATGELASALVGGGRMSWVTITTNDTMHIFDDTFGTLSKYAPSGALVMMRALPPTLLDSLRAKAAEFAKSLASFRVTEYDVPLIKGLRTTADGDLLLSVNGGTTVALIVDPRSYRVRRLLIPQDDATWRFVRDARSMALHGRRLYVLRGDEIRAYSIREQS